MKLALLMIAALVACVAVMWPLIGLAALVIP